MSACWRCHLGIVQKTATQPTKMVCRGGAEDKEAHISKVQAELPGWSLGWVGVTPCG